MKLICRSLLVAVAFATAARLGAQESNDASTAAPTPQPLSSTEAAPAPQVTLIPVMPAVAPPPAVSSLDTSAPTAMPPSTSSAAPPVSAHKVSRTPRAKAAKETKESAASAPSDQSAAPAAGATAATASSDSSTNPPPAPPAAGAVSSANSAVPTVPIADRPVAGSAQTPAKRGMSAGNWLLIGGLSVGILGIAALLRRRRSEENISIVDHSTPPRTGTTIAHHP